MEQNMICTKTNTNNKKNMKGHKIRSYAKKFTISVLVISLPVLYVSLLHIPLSILFTDTTFWFLMSNFIIIIVAADSGVFSSSSSTKENDLYDEYMLHARAVRTNHQCITNLQPSTTHNTTDHRKNTNEAVQDKTIVLYDNPAMQKDHAAEKTIVAQEIVANGKQEVLILSHDKNLKPVSEEEPEMRTAEMEKNERRVVLHQKSLSQVEIGAASDHAEKRSLRRSMTEKKYCGDNEDIEYSKLSDEELNRRIEEFIRRFNREIRLEMRNE